MNKSTEPIIIFDTPPVSRRRSSGPPEETPIGRWLSEARKYPGQWLRWPELMPNPHAASSVIRRGKMYGAKPGEFEARGVMVTPDKRSEGKRGLGQLYVRYVAHLDVES
jgi:hypothetical protein